MLRASIPDEIDFATDGVDVRVLDTRPPRLEYSVGTYRADSDPSVRDLYEPNAYLPNGGWVPVEDIGSRPSKPDSSNTIASIPVPPRVVAELLGAMQRSRGILDSPFNVTTLTCEEVTELKAILSEVQGIQVTGDPKGLARVRYRSDLPTSTSSVQSGKQVGLHVDIWDRMGWSKSWMGGNRISINLSHSSRYFIFVPIQVCRLASVLMRNNQSLTDDNFNLATEYFRGHPQAPIYRLRVDPGHAYVAPTENIIHDGIPAADHVDETLVIRGRFEVTR